MPNKKHVISVLVVGVLLTMFALKSLFSSPVQKIEKNIESVESKSESVESPISTSTDIQNSIVPETDLLTPHEKSIILPIVDEREPNTKHPFEKVSLHIVGRSNIRGDGRVIDIVQISASKNNNVMFILDSNDLFRSGYNVEVYADCSARITYDDYSEFIVCDSPDQAGNKQGTIAQTFSPQ
jgi:hypothetical protein